jgi:hypothetical protein
MVLFLAKTASDHTFFKLVPRPHNEKYETKLLKFPTLGTHVIVKFLTQGKQVAVKSCGYTR